MCIRVAQTLWAKKMFLKVALPAFAPVPFHHRSVHTKNEPDWMTFRGVAKSLNFNIEISIVTSSLITTDHS